MTRRNLATPPPLPSSTGRSRRSIHDEDLKDDLKDDLDNIPHNWNDRGDDISESDDGPVRRPSRKAMGKPPSTDSFTSILGKCVPTTQLAPTSVQPLHPERREVYIVSEEEDEREPTLLVSTKVSK
jgi:hypothetical protein